MFFIVIFHFIVHGVMHQHTFPEFGYNITSMSPAYLKINYFFLQNILSIVSTGVNLFVMMSGYYLIQKKKLRVNSLIKLWIKLFSYSVIIGFLAYIIGMTGEKDLIMSFFPLSLNRYWFMLPYFALMLVAPFIARFTCVLNEKQYVAFLCIFLLICFYLPFGRLICSWGNDLLWFVFLFCCGGYIRLYPPNYTRSNRFRAIFCILAGMALLFFVPIFRVFVVKISTGSFSSLYLYEPKYNGVCFLLSILIFWFFVNMKVSSLKYNSIISIVSKSTIGVYLVHDNLIVRNYIWEEICDFSTLPSSCVFWPSMLVICCSVFLGGVIIDVMMEGLLKIIYSQSWFQYIERYTSDFFSKITQ